MGIRFLPSFSGQEYHSFFPASPSASFSLWIKIPVFFWHESMIKRVSCVRTRFEAKAMSISIFSSAVAHSRASSIPLLLRGISIQPERLSPGFKPGSPCLTSIR